MLDQGRERLRSEVAPRDPGDGLDVAQAARTVLDVRLEVVAGVVELGVALALLLHLCLEEPPARPDSGRAGPFPHPPEQVRGPAHEPSVHQVGGHGDVASRLVHALAHGPDAVSHLEPHVPQEREESLDLLARVPAQRSPNENQQVDVGARQQLPAPVAADRDERVPGVVVESESAPGEREDTVHEPGPRLDERGHRLAPVEARFQTGLRCGERVANVRQRRVDVHGRGKRLDGRAGSRACGSCPGVVHRIPRSFTRAAPSTGRESQCARSSRARSRSQSRLRSAARLSCRLRPRAVARSTFARPRVQCMSRATRV